MKKLREHDKKKPSLAEAFRAGKEWRVGKKIENRELERSIIKGSIILLLLAGGGLLLFLYLYSGLIWRKLLWVLNQPRIMWPVTITLAIIGFLSFLFHAVSEVEKEAQLKQQEEEKTKKEREAKLKEEQERKDRLAEWDFKIQEAERRKRYELVAEKPKDLLEEHRKEKETDRQRKKIDKEIRRKEYRDEIENKFAAEKDLFDLEEKKLKEAEEKYCEAKGLRSLSEASLEQFKQWKEEWEQPIKNRFYQERLKNP